MVEAALSISISTLTADIYGDGQWSWGRFSSAVRIFGTRCGSSQVWGSQDGFTYFDFRRTIFWTLSMVSSSVSQIERLDSLLLHRPDALMEPEEVAAALITWSKRAGPSFGVSNQKSHDDGIAQSSCQTTAPRSASCSWFLT